ncbi:MAG: hypothetical protein JSU68_09615 [Phycisphaerales bacterium]|nr:MAG: hypothetical protein JSU68_09615 [Phycisphaerales bacterium]
MARYFRGLRVARRFVAGVCAVVLLLGVCPQATADRPTAVDHSTEAFFPPIGHQEIGDCTCWSSAYYYNTYTQARDEGLDASGGDSEVICSPRFLFALIAEGAAGAECTEHAMARLSDLGCAPVSMHSMSEWYSEWPTEAARVAALKNRTGTFYKIRSDSEAGLATVRQHIAEGGCAVTRALFHSNYVNYGASASGPGIDNRVMYAGVGGNHLRHSLCICGYDDNKAYVDHRDGETYEGAFLIANSEGLDWGWYNSTGSGTKGFLWVSYRMFYEGEFGLYDHDDNPYVDPCYDNPAYPEIYYHDDRPHYRPRLYAAAGINHNARNLLTYTGGVGPTDTPDFMGPEAIEQTDFGDISIDDSRRVVVDLTDGVGFIPPGTTKNVFVSLFVNSAATQAATITSVDFYCDFNGNEVYRTVPGQMGPPVMVWPNTTKYVSASVTHPVPGDLDVDLDVDVEDHAMLVSCMTGPDQSVSPSCDLADLSGDADADLEDFAAFQRQFVVP